nr:MAG TPA: hypothetical protein [Caudoviricetes sp.]
MEKQAFEQALNEAVAPLHNAKLRAKIIQQAKERMKSEKNPILHRYALDLIIGDAQSHLDVQNVLESENGALLVKGFEQAFASVLDKDASEHPLFDDQLATYPHYLDRAMFLLFAKGYQLGANHE